jgi:hypothetical protein
MFVQKIRLEGGISGHSFLTISSALLSAIPVHLDLPQSRLEQRKQVIVKLTSKHHTQFPLKKKN